MIKLHLKFEPNIKEGVTLQTIGISAGNKSWDNLKSSYEIGTSIENEYKNFDNFSWPGDEPLELFAPTIKIDDVDAYYLEDIPKNTLLTVKNNNDKHPTFDFIELSNDTISFRCYFNYLDWVYDWNIKLHIVEITKELKKYYSQNLQGYKTSSAEEYSTLHFKFNNLSNCTIKDLVAQYTPIATNIYDDVMARLEERHRSYPFTATFSFPEHIKYECERYLSYFGQFLCDIGIEADTDIKRKGREVLFSVTPGNKNEAIEKIGQALALFLTIPVLPPNSLVPNSSAIENQIKVQRMQSAIAHLHSELKLAEAIVMAKNNHIDSLMETNSNILALSLEKIAEQDKETDGISLFEDVIKIKKYKGKGFEINMPKLISKAKNILKAIKK